LPLLRKPQNNDCKLNQSRPKKRRTVGAIPGRNFLQYYDGPFSGLGEKPAPKDRQQNALKFRGDKKSAQKSWEGGAANTGKNTIKTGGTGKKGQTQRATQPTVHWKKSTLFRKNPLTKLPIICGRLLGDGGKNRAEGHGLRPYRRNRVPERRRYRKHAFSGQKRGGFFLRTR